MAISVQTIYQWKRCLFFFLKRNQIDVGIYKKMLKCNSDFRKKLRLAATLPRGYRRHDDDRVGGCAVFARFSYI